HFPDHPQNRQHLTAEAGNRRGWAITEGAHRRSQKDRLHPPRHVENRHPIPLEPSDSMMTEMLPD
ncbi:hypothetical protein, partial [Aurantimonas coralicida]|uniref:hypothetical protein n=1 Tax=Aurantimonas coralicida TaxID=182270 RepID=UPI001D17FB78